MTYKKFKKIIDLMVAQNKFEHKLYKIGIDIFDAQRDNEQVINLLLYEVLNEDGTDMFSWFMYEKAYVLDGKGRKDIKGKGCNTPKELYNYLIKNKCFK